MVRLHVPWLPREMGEKVFILGKRFCSGVFYGKILWDIRLYVPAQEIFA